MLRWARPVKRRTFNPKRKFASPGDLDPAALTALANCVQYGGNPEHKRDPGDFGLSPPHAAGRPAKSLCDDAGITAKARAFALLQEGLRRGLVSEQRLGSWPKNVWAVSAEGHALEGQLEREGVYHGYPMPDSDPFREEVLLRWEPR